MVIYDLTPDHLEFFLVNQSVSLITALALLSVRSWLLQTILFEIFGKKGLQNEKTKPRYRYGFFPCIEFFRNIHNV